MLLAVTVTLAFTPHYSCGCGDEGQQKVRGSKLRHYAIKIAENAVGAIRPVFD